MQNFLNKLEELGESGAIYEIADKVYSASDIVRHLGYSVNGKRINTVLLIADKYEVDTSHWTSNGKPTVTKLSKICPVCDSKFSFFEREPRATCSYSCSNTLFRSGKDNPNWIEGGGAYRVKALAYYLPICTRCNYSENIAAIVVHHKDRDRSNSTMENLEVLCANCHAIEHWQDKI